MPVKWCKSDYPGVRYYKHATRKHGVKFDQYFAIRYQKNGTRREEGLGWASQGWSAERANEVLTELKKNARTGEGERTLLEKRERQERERREEEARLRKEKTVAELIDEYIEKHAKRKKVRWQEDERALNFDVLPAMGDWLAKDVTRQDAANLLEGIVQRGAPVQACNVLEKCRKMFNLAMAWGYIEHNPFAGQERPAPRPERDRVLADDEIRILWAALAPDNTSIAMSQKMRRAFKLMLATGQRPGEVIGLHRREIHGRWWTIPKNRSKNGKPHRVYLTDLALDLIGTGKGFIFPSPKCKDIKGKVIDRPISENAMALNLRRNILGAKDGKKVKGLAGRKKLQAKKKIETPSPINRIGVEFFRPHDLRRTVLTGLARLKVPYEVRERIVNHSLGKLEKTYNLHDYDDEKIAAMERWTAYLQCVITGNKESGKVVNLFPLPNT